MSTSLKTLLKESPKDAKAAVRIAAALENVQSYLRSVSRRNDTFAGYSLAESLQERINQIGDKNTYQQDGVTVDSDTSPGVTYGGRETLLARLSWLEKQLLGEHGNDGLIAEAKEFEVGTKVDDYLAEDGEAPK